MKNLLLLFLLVFCINLSAKDKVRSGPMLGYAEMREVLIWLQTNENSQVYIEYTEQEGQKNLYKTKTVITTDANWNVAHLICDKVVPNMTYTYKVFVDGEEQKFDYPLEFNSLIDWKYKEAELPNVRFAFGSGSFINDPKYDRAGKGYGGNYEIYESMAKKDLDFTVWLGDNVYYREADWNTRTGMYYRNTQVRELPELQELLASCNHYAIWDDHDYGPNDSDGSFIHKEMAWQVFKDFWGNPTYGLPGKKGCTSMFSWADLDVFMLDNRYFRTPNYKITGEKTILGKEQIDWLINALSFSKAKFKIIAMGGQFLNPHAEYENYSNIAPAERDYILDEIEANNIKGVIFITGDRHYSEVTALKRNDNYTLYDFTASPFNSGAYKTACETPNYLRVKGSCVNQRNFGMIEISGPEDDRSVRFVICDVNGAELWSKTFSEQDFE